MTTTMSLQVVYSSNDEPAMTYPLKIDEWISGFITGCPGIIFTSSTPSITSGYDIQRDTAKLSSCIIYLMPSNLGEGMTDINTNNLSRYRQYLTNRVLDENNYTLKILERVGHHIIDKHEGDTVSSGMKMYFSSAASNAQEDSYGVLISPESALNEKRLIGLIQQQPIEDGYGHPAEELIEESLKSSPFNPNHWVYNTYVHNTKSHPTIAATILRCLGRAPRFLTRPWGVLLAIQGLTHEDVEVRDAAVRVLEKWGGYEAFEALKTRVTAEPSSWLASYIRQVIRDLED